MEAQKIWNSSPETPGSLFGLGMLNLNGLGGLKKNTEKGISYLEKAVNAGNREAAMELGKHYRNLGDTEKALLFISKGCDEKDANCNRMQAEIYAKAYSQDSDFFGFYRSLNAYKKTLTSSSTLVLEPNSDFFQYFKSKK